MMPPSRFAESLLSNNQAELDRKYRYYNYVEQKDRFNDLLRPFTHLFRAGAAGQSSPGEAVNG